MINFDTSEPNIRQAMGVTDEDIRKSLDILYQSSDNTIVWLIQRIWVDETLQDNTKCFLLFHAGVLWEKFNKGKDTHGNGPWYN